VPVTAPIKPVRNSSSTSLIKREKRRGDNGQPCLFDTSQRHNGITGTGSFGTINQNIHVSIVHLFDDIDKVSGHPDLI